MTKGKPKGRVTGKAPSQPKSQPNRHRELAEPSDEPLRTMTASLTENEHAVSEYLWTLAHPEDGPICGVPLPIGGYTPDSTTVCLTGEGGFWADNDGFATLQIFGASGVGDVEGAPYSAFSDATRRVPCQSFRQVVGIHNLKNVAYATPPPFGTNIPLASWQQIVLPDTGVDLRDADARLVSASIEIFSDSASLTRKGTGMLVTPGVWSDSSALNDTYVNVYAQPRNHKVVGNLADEHLVFRAVYVPSRQEQLWWCDTSTTSGAPTNLGGLPIFAFYAINLDLQQSFRYTVTWNYEINSNYVRAMSSNLIASSGMEVLHHATREMPPAIMVQPKDPGAVLPQTRGPRVRDAAMKVAAVLGRLFQNGPRVAKAIGSGLSFASKAIAPALISAAPLILSAMARNGKKGPLLLR